MAMLTCKICKWHRVEQIIFCNNCGISSCDLCQIKHKQSCQSLKINKYYMCKLHDCQVYRYCCECFQLICEQCSENNHKEHNIVGLRDAWENIRRDIHGEINEMEAKTKHFSKECWKTQKDLAAVLVVINEEEKKWRTHIDEITTTLTSKVNADIQLIESKLKTNEMFVSDLNENKNSLTNLKSESFELLCLYQYSNIMCQQFETEKQRMRDRILPPTLDVPNIRNQFKALILNYKGSSVDKSQNTDEEGVDELAKAISNITLNETGRNQQFTSDSELTRLHHCEATFMKDMMKSMIQCIMETDRMTSQSEYLSKLPKEQNPVKNEFLEQVKYVLNHVIKITNDLRKREQELKDKCLVVAEWTNSYNEVCFNELYSQTLKEKLAFCESEAHFYKNKTKELETAYDNLYRQTTTWQQTSEKYVDVKVLTKEDDARQKDEMERILKEKDDAIELLRKEKDDLQNRFSSIAGEKLREGNPAIANLGDPNRPLKIGDKYGHLYDNEWTDAMACISTVSSLFPKLQQTEIEEVVVRHLCYILQCCYKECLFLAQEQLQSIVHTLQLDEDEKCNDLSLVPICKDVAYIRRQNCAKFSNFLYKEKVLVAKISSKDWDYSEKSDDLIRQLTETDFFQECVQLCWTMVIQDPAIHLDENLPLSTVYNKTNYKEFTESGDKVKYVVWPALFLYKDGPLLFKGVVQAYK